MKKNFKRKNYVLIGAIGIAAVALTSVGFATWITGMQNLTAPADITNIVHLECRNIRIVVRYFSDIVTSGACYKTAE